MRRVPSIRDALSRATTRRVDNSSRNAVCRWTSLRAIYVGGRTMRRNLLANERLHHALRLHTAYRSGWSGGAWQAGARSRRDTAIILGTLAARH